jgi:hypothetical protein
MHLTIIPAYHMGRMLVAYKQSPESIQIGANLCKQMLPYIVLNLQNEWVIAFLKGLFSVVDTRSQTNEVVWISIVRISQNLLPPSKFTHFSSSLAKAYAQGAANVLSSQPCASAK